MQLNLNKDDLISLVRGSEPSFSIMNHSLIAALGEYHGQYDQWAWNRYKLEERSEEELYAVYQLCKSSWKV